MLEEPHIRNLNVRDHPPTTVGACVGDGVPHQWCAGAAGAAVGQYRQAIALPQPAVLIEWVEAHRTDRLVPPECDYADHAVTRIVCVDVRFGEDCLFLDEDGVPDTVMHTELIVRARFDTADLVGLPAARAGRGSGGANCMREVHGRACTVGSCMTFCRLLIAEQAWQRAQPADTMLASIPRRAMYADTRR